MTRRDYLLLSGALSSAKPSDRGVPPEWFEAQLAQWSWTVTVVCTQLQTGNRHFDALKFFKDCGDDAAVARFLGLT